MKALAGVLVAVAFLVGACWMSTELFGDRQLFTSPPDAVSEGFLREVVMKRYSRARPMLLDRVDDADLAAMHDRIASRAGEPDRFDAEIVTIDQTRARTTVRLESEKGSIDVPLSLEFESGEWKIRSESVKGNETQAGSPAPGLSTCHPRVT